MSSFTTTAANKRTISSVDELPDEIQAAHRSLCRLHLMKKPLKEQIDEYEEEMKRFKDILKEYCQQQDNSDLVDPHTHLKVQNIITNRVKTPSLEEMYQVTSEVLNALQTKMADRITKAVLPLLLPVEQDQVRNRIKLECQLSVVDTVQQIRHALAKPEYTNVSVTHSLRIIPYEECNEKNGKGDQEIASSKSKKAKRS